MNYPKNLRGLSIAGPYPWLIAIGEKDAEFRTWPINNYRGLVLLHNSLSREWDADWAEFIEAERISQTQTRQMKGKIIGFAFLTDCEHTAEYDGYFHVMKGAALFPEPDRPACPGNRNYWSAKKPEQVQAFELAWQMIADGRYDAWSPDETMELLVRDGYQKPTIYIVGAGGRITTNADL